METSIFAAHAIADFGTARQALVRSTVGIALGYLNAQDWDADEPNKLERELFKKAMKAAMRDGGNDRKTADRHVNTACTMAGKLFTQLDMSIRHHQSERDMIDNVTQNLWSRGGTSIAAVKRLLDTGSAVEAVEAEKTPQELAKETEQAATVESDAIAKLIEGFGAVDLEAEPEPVAKDEMSQIETVEAPAFDLATMSDADLAALAAAVAAERSKRKTEGQAVA